MPSLALLLTTSSALLFLTQVFGGSYCKEQSLIGNQEEKKLFYAPYLCEHGLAMLSDHSTLVTVKRDKVIVEGLLGMLQDIVQFSSTSFKDTAEVARNQGAANR